MRQLLWIASVIAMVGNASSQVSNVPIKFSGQIRVRSETDGRDFSNDSDLNTYTLLRSRFGAEIQPREDVKVFLQIQDSRAFGQEPGTLANTANLDIHQAFFVISDLWNKPISLKIGRQEMIYGSQRLIGAVGFSNVGRSFDGVKWTFGRTNQVDVFGMTIDESTNPGLRAGQENRDHRFFGVYYKRHSNPVYTFDLYGLFESDLRKTSADDNLLERATLGAYNKGKLSSEVDFETELAVQLGRRRGEDVRAFMLAGSVGYTF